MAWNFPTIPATRPILNTPQSVSLQDSTQECVECPERYCYGRFDFFIQYWWYEGCTDLDTSTLFISLDPDDYTVGIVEELGYGCFNQSLFLTYPTGDSQEPGPSAEIIGVNVPWEVLDNDNLEPGEEPVEYHLIRYAAHWYEPQFSDLCDGKFSVFVTLHNAPPWAEVSRYLPDGTREVLINTPIIEHHLQETDVYDSCSIFTRGMIAFDRDDCWFGSWPKTKKILGERHPYWGDQN